jgi:transcription initiation factor TFIIIB Brf1 subunit/transcription initiation factor TFIIB
LDKIRILFCQGRKQMHLNERMTKKVMDIKQTAIGKKQVLEKHPMGLAAAVLYITQLDNNIKDDIHTMGNERTRVICSGSRNNRCCFKTFS